MDFTISKNALDQLKNDEGIKRQDEMRTFFCHAFIEKYWDTHYTWLHREDDRSNIYGHSSHKMPLHQFLMHDELNNIASNWRNMPEFRECCDLMSTLYI